MITILDGGMGGERLRRSDSKPTGLWSAEALLRAPEQVAPVHRAYIDAGSQVITTNSYSSIPSTHSAPRGSPTGAAARGHPEPGRTRRAGTNRIGDRLSRSRRPHGQRALTA